VSGIRAIKRTQDVVFDKRSFYDKNEDSDDEDSDNEVSETISTEAQDLLDLHENPQTAGGENEVGERESTST
jgi:hypothetical protein